MFHFTGQKAEESSLKPGIHDWGSPGPRKALGLRTFTLAASWICISLLLASCLITSSWYSYSNTALFILGLLNVVLYRMHNYCILLVWSRLTVTEGAKRNMRNSDWKLRVQNKMGQILTLHSGPLRAALPLESSAHIPQCRHWLGSQSIIATRLESFLKKSTVPFFQSWNHF